MTSKKIGIVKLDISDISLQSQDFITESQRVGASHCRTAWFFTKGRATSPIPVRWDTDLSQKIW